MIWTSRSCELVAGVAAWKEVGVKSTWSFERRSLALGSSGELPWLPAEVKRQEVVERTGVTQIETVHESTVKRQVQKAVLAEIRQLSVRRVD